MAMVRRILAFGLILLLISGFGTAQAQCGPNEPRPLDTAYRLSLIDHEQIRAVPGR